MVGVLPLTTVSTPTHQPRNLPCPAVATKSNKVAAAQTGYEKLPESMQDPMKRAKMHAMASKMLDRRVCAFMGGDGISLAALWLAT